MRWPHDGQPCPDGEGLYARIDKLYDPWVKLRVRMIWIFGGYKSPRRSAGARI